MDQGTFDALTAAQEQAYWASSAALAAWFIGLASLLITGGGLFFVWRQLKIAELNAKAAVDAAHAALLSSRPWIEINIVGDTEHWTNPDGTARLEFSISLANIGNAPALDVIVDANIVSFNEWNLDAEKVVGNKPAYGLRAEALLPGVKTTIDMGTGWREFDHPDISVLLLTCRYSVPGVEDFKYTAKTYLAYASGVIDFVRDDTEVRRVSLTSSRMRLLMT